MLLEAHCCGHVSFLTLTYGDPPPVGLNYSDISGFLKRLRTNSRQAVRFFCCGELGDVTKRPHWHLIVFSDAELLPVGLHATKEWPHGGMLVAAATPATMAYTAGYSLKKRLGDMRIEMSRRPGLGMERAAYVGQEMARQMRSIDTFPTVMRIGKHLYPLHRRLRDLMLASYVGHGGIIERRERPKGSLEIEAELITKQGKYSLQTKIADRALDRLIVSDKERVHGKIEVVAPPARTIEARVRKAATESDPCT